MALNSSTEWEWVDGRENHVGGWWWCIGQPMTCHSFRHDTTRYISPSRAPDRGSCGGERSQRSLPLPPSTTHHWQSPEVSVCESCNILLSIYRLYWFSTAENPSTVSTLSHHKYSEWRIAKTLNQYPQPTRRTRGREEKKGEGTHLEEPLSAGLLSRHYNHKIVINQRSLILAQAQDMKTFTATLPSSQRMRNWRRS